MPVIVRATYSLTTPLFSAGAVQDEPELRLPSFKGVLRFWWRALAWSRFQGDLQRIREEESRTFGSPGKDGQSALLMRIVVENRGTRLRRGEYLVRNLRPGGPAAHPQGVYYLGYGLVQGGGQQMGCIQRAALCPPLRFTVEMLVRKNKISDASFETLIDALKAIGLMGGMGARSRRGFGSLTLNRLTVGSHGSENVSDLWQPPASVDQLREALARFSVAGAPRRFPEYTALSPFARSVVVTSSTTKEPLRLLDQIGLELMLYRGWGRNGQVAGRRSERRFKEDHDLMLELKESVRTHPRRIAFGLPHNYRFSSLSKAEKPNRSVRPVGPPGKKLYRRASPLFIHIHLCGTTPVGVLTFLPARFLPAGSKVAMEHIRVELEKDLSNLYEPVEEFLNRLLKRSQEHDNTPKTGFGTATEVRWV